MIRQLLNVSGVEITISDLNGMVIPVDQSVDGLAFGETALRASNEVLVKLLTGHLSLSDGTNTYTGSTAIDVIKGTTDQLTRDGKRITTSSDRPIDHYRHITGYGDNMVTKQRGEGTELVFDVAPTSDQTIDVQFLDNVYIKDGSVLFQNAALDSRLTIETFAPAGIPFPAANNGNTDLVGATFVANTMHTGKYWTLGTETRLFRFVNKLHILGNGREDVTSPEPVLVPTPYITRFTLHNAGTVSNLSACINMGLYRKQTV